MAATPRAIAGGSRQQLKPEDSHAVCRQIPGNDGFSVPRGHGGRLPCRECGRGPRIGGPGIYRYAVRLELRGPGGQQGVKQALKQLFSTHCSTFSGYGNSYQLWFGRPEIENLGDSRYAVIVEGAGARTFLEDDLERFLTYLVDESLLQSPLSPSAKKALVEEYLDQYRAEVKRLVDRYRSKLRKSYTSGF
jgi:hypothetical protein